MMERFKELRRHWNLVRNRLRERTNHLSQHVSNRLPRQFSHIRSRPRVPRALARLTHVRPADVRSALGALTRWAAFSADRRRVVATALCLLVLSALLTSTVSAALLSGHAILPRSSTSSTSSTSSSSSTGTSSGQVGPQGSRPGTGSRPPAPTPTPQHPSLAPHATPTPQPGGAGSSPTPTPSTSSKPPAGATPTPTSGKPAPKDTAPSKQVPSGSVATASGPTKPTPHPMAHPATSSSADVLILDTSVTNGINSVEAQQAEQLGLSVEVDDATTWAAKTTSDFAQYKAIVLGDPTCGAAGEQASYIGPAQSNASTWGPAITGNVILIGTDPVFHSPDQTGATALINAGIAYAAGRPGTTGLYFSLSCYYIYDGPGTDEPVLDAISTPGQFTIEGEQGLCPNTVHIVTASEAMAGLSDSNLSNWSCSTHAAFDSWPSDFSVLAINEDMSSSYVAPDGSHGAPYIMARGSAAVGATGTERLSGGNLSENTSGSNCVCKPIDTYSGDFWHTFDLFNIPGRGIPLQLTMTYNAQAASQSGPLGFGWSQSAGASLAVDGGTGDVTITQENGGTVGFTPNGSGGYTAPSRVLAGLVKNGDGSYTLTRIQDQTHLTFNASGQLISEADRNGYTTTYGYTSGVLTSITDTSGRSLSLTYDTSNRIVQVADPISRHVSFTYDGSGNLATYTDVAGGVWHFTYDSTHRLLTMSDPRSEVTTNVYDSSNRVISQTDALNRTTTMSYVAPDSNGNSSTTITDPNGNVTVDHYLNAMLVSQTKGYGTAQAATWSYSYDPVTLGLAATIDPNGNISGETWDANGNLLSSIDNLDRITTYTYNSFNEVTSTTDPLGVTTSNTYDAKGNLLSTSRPLAGTSQVQTTSYTYGDATHPGDVTAMTDPNGRTWHYTYDADGNRLSTTDPLGEKSTSTYDGIGRLLTQISPNGYVSGNSAANYTTSYAYDAFGDTTQVTDPLGKTTLKQYDADRNLTQTTDADGHVTTNTYDLDNELTQVARPDGSVLKYSYDADGNQTGQTDGLNRTTSYGYDALNRLVSTTDPLGRTTSYGYDHTGNRTSTTDAASNVTTDSYDAANELTQISYSDGLTPYVYLYYDLDGQRTTMYDGTGATNSTYDSLHRLTSQTNGLGQTVGYAYDLDGHLTGLTYPSGLRVTRSYDAAGRWRTISDGYTTIRMRYDADGNLIETTLPSGLDTTRTYDAADRLATISDFQQYAGSPFLSFGYSRDALGMVTGEKPLKPNTTLASGISGETYGYSNLNQVSTLNGTTYTYDKGDNLTGRGTAALAYDAGDELTSQTAGATTTSYGYDARGNRMQASAGGPTTTYGYDQANRLTSYQNPAGGGVSAQYSYNGDGLRMSKTVNGGFTEFFAWDTAEGLPLLLDDSGTQYVYGPGGLPLEQIGGSSGTLYYLADQLGSTRELVDTFGNALATYTYDAYGALTASTGSGIVNPFGFAGQYSDVESGLQYLRARYFDPATAQFLTRDPLLPLSQQPYGYANGNPLNATDASGQLVLGICVGGSAGWGAGLQGQACNVTDFHQFGNTGAVGGGAQSPQAGVGISLLIDWGSTDVTQEEGTSYYAETSPGWHALGGSVSGPVNFSPCSPAQFGAPTSLNIGVGIGVAPADASAGYAHTWVQKLTWQQELMQLLPALRIFA